MDANTIVFEEPIFWRTVKHDPTCWGRMYVCGLFFLVRFKIDFITSE